MFGKKKYDPEELKLKNAVEELKKGSAEAFHLLYSHYNDKIYRFCLRMLGDKAAAEDAFQETFIKIYENRLNFRGDSFQAWLFTIARHTCLNYLRKKKDTDVFVEEFHGSSIAAESDSTIQEMLHKAIEKLPENLREVILLREYEDLAYNDIADALGIKLSLVKVRVHRARLILRKMLQPVVKDLYESR